MPMMVGMTGRCAALVALLAVLASSVDAQRRPQGKYDPDVRFWVKPLQSADIGPGLSARDARTLAARLRELTERVAANPTFRSPPPNRCHYLAPFIDGADAQQGRPAAIASLYVAISPWLGAQCDEKSVGVTISVNNLDEALPGSPEEDAEGKMYRWKDPLPAAPFSRHGPIAHIPALTILTRRTTPLLLPVPQDRLLRYFVQRVERDLAKAERDLAAHPQQREAIRAAAQPREYTPVHCTERWRREEKPKLEAANAQVVKLLEENARKSNDPAMAKQAAETRENFAKRLAAMEESCASNAADAAKPRPAPVVPDDSWRFEHQIGLLRKDRDALRALAGSLTATEQKAPACSGRRPASESPTYDLFCGKASEVTWVTRNPNFFDRSIPRGEIQLAVITYRFEDARRLFDALSPGAEVQSLLR